MTLYLAGLTAAQLADCPDASAYAASIHAFLWSGLSPSILAISSCRLTLNILYSIFSNV